jgi:hypothetical protein
MLACNENICECFVVHIEFALQNNIPRQQNKHYYKISWQRSSVIHPVSLHLWFFSLTPDYFYQSIPSLYPLPIGMEIPLTSTSSAV